MEETRAIHQSIESKPGSIGNAEDAISLERFISEEAAPLLGILRSYVVQYTLVDRKEDVQDGALELLHETYIRAAKSFATFDSSRPIRAWLLAIARNLALDKQAARGKRKQHETLMCDFRQQTQHSQKDEDPLERLIVANQQGSEQQIELRERITYLLSQLSEEYQYVLQLWAVEGLDGTELAEKLSCSRNSALVRLHRARKQLRTILATEKGGENG